MEKTTKIIVKTTSGLSYEITTENSILPSKENGASLCHLPKEEIEAVYDGNLYHICKYCGEIAYGPDKDRLCEDCRSMFGHSFFSEL